MKKQVLSRIDDYVLHKRKYHECSNVKKSIKGNVMQLFVYECYFSSSIFLCTKQGIHWHGCHDTHEFLTGSLGTLAFMKFFESLLTFSSSQCASAKGFIIKIILSSIQIQKKKRKKNRGWGAQSHQWKLSATLMFEQWECKREKTLFSNVIHVVTIMN